MDRDIIRAVATHAELAVELTEARSDNEQLRRMEDRQKIAEELRQRAVQRLFAHGLALQGAAARASNQWVRAAIEAQIRKVDSIIVDIRAAVFALNRPPTGSGSPGAGSE